MQSGEKKERRRNRRTNPNTVNPLWGRGFKNSGVWGTESLRIAWGPLYHPPPPRHTRVRCLFVPLPSLYKFLLQDKKRPNKSHFFIPAAISKGGMCEVCKKAFPARGFIAASQCDSEYCWRSSGTIQQLHNQLGTIDKSSLFS